MALGKKPTVKTAKPAAKPAKSPVKVLFLSDKELVLKLNEFAECLPIKKGFVVFDEDGKNKSPLHSGIAKTKDDAWKLAAHNL